MANVKAMAMLLMALCSSFMLQTAYGAGECGKTPINTVALSLSPCIGAASNAKASVPPACCTQVKKVLTMPACMCAVFLSPIAKQAGINPAVAIGIPKRCNIANRYAGKKCGKYIVP